MYVEKARHSHNIFEGRKMIEAARKYKTHGAGRPPRAGLRIHKIKAVELLRDGVIGDIYQAKGMCYKTPQVDRQHEPQRTFPAGVEYDLWTGPADKVDFKENRFHYNWHWYWAFGNGDIGKPGRS